MDLLNNRIVLPIDQIPKNWLNIAPFLPAKPYPLLLPNGKPAPAEAMMRMFPVGCVMQAVSQDEFIPIPQEVREALALNQRPTPLHRAFRLEKKLGLDSDKVKIYFKNESVSPTGSHKANTAIPQAYYAKLDKLKGLTTETGAGQWGSALAMAGGIYGLDIKVFQVRISYQQKPGRVVMISNYGADIVPSPSNLTNSGRQFYDKDPNHPGSLGIAISEAVEKALSDPAYKYSLGSVVDFVCLHQTVIGQEAQIQMQIAGDKPDVVIGCIGGGSNFAGLTFPYMKDKLTGKDPNVDIVGVEPMACPSLTKGVYAWDYGDSAHQAPICKMYTVGASYIPPPVHAGGLRYHGAAPLVSLLKHHNKMRTVAIHQRKATEAGILFSRCESILPAPESNHAIAVAIDEALAAKDKGEKKTILFNLSGHGHFDTAVYKSYIDGKLEDYEYQAKEIEKALLELPKIDEKTLGL